MCVVATLLLLVSQLTASPPAPAAVVEPVVVASATPVVAPKPAPPAAIERRQSAQGTIEGTVTDQQGAVVPGARVSLTSAVNATTQSATSDARGRFVFANVPAGSYDATVSLSGFRTWRQRVQLAAGQRAAMEVRLEIGGLTETITLTGPPKPGAQPPVPVTEQPRRSAPELYDAAKLLYQQGRFAEAEAITLQVLSQVRVALRENAASAGLASTASGPVPVRVGGSIREPRKIRHVDPIYPQDAWAAGIGGYVIIEAVVASDGSVRDAKVLGGEPMFTDAALAAVRQWQYSPTLLNNIPVEVVMNVTVHFRLR